MKKAFLALVLVFALFGCNDSGSSSPAVIPTPPVIKDKLTFLENSTPHGAIIFKDGVLDRSTPFTYGIENLTNVEYNNVSFTIEPSDPTKYTLSASSCTSLKYNTGCLIYVYVDTKTTDDIKFSIKMNSDRGAQTFTTTPIKANYAMQPSVAALSIANGATQTFVVRNSMTYTVTIDGDILYKRDNRVLSIIPQYTFTAGTAGFSIVDTDVLKPFTIDGTEEKLKNCFATGKEVGIPNAGVNACYVEVAYTNANTAPQSDTLEISVKVRAGRVNVWKSAPIALTGTN